jgi:hypothetical protein
LHAVGHHEEVATTTICMFLVIFIFCKGSRHWYLSSWSSLVNGGQALHYCIADCLLVGLGVPVFATYIYLFVCATSCMYE